MADELRKGDFFAYVDRGIYGTFVKNDFGSTENGFVDIYYYPLLDKRFGSKGKEQIVRNVPLDAQHVVRNPFPDGGTQKNIYFIFTDEPGSIVSNIFRTKSQKTIEELKEIISSLKKQNAAKTQEVINVQSGMNKYLESVKSATKRERSPFGELIGPRPSSFSRSMPFSDGFPDIDGGDD